jgi:hypothetical protein
MANSGGSFWGSKEGVTAWIRSGHIHVLACKPSSNPRGPHATMPTARGDRIGRPIWKSDCCTALARAVLQRVEERGIPASWH